MDLSWQQKLSRLWPILCRVTPAPWIHSSQVMRIRPNISVARRGSKPAPSEANNKKPMHNFTGLTMNSCQMLQVASSLLVEVWKAKQMTAATLASNSLWKGKCNWPEIPELRLLQHQFSNMTVLTAFSDL